MNDTLYELFHRCTVRLVDTSSHEQGTGFFVAPELILTCAHVVSKACQHPQSLEVSWETQTNPAQEIECFEEVDLALVRIASFPDHPCALLDEALVPHDPLYCYGYPAKHRDGDSGTFRAEGWTQVGKETLLKFKAGQVEPGMSGAPLLNEQTGRVCGIIALTRDRSTDLGGRAIRTRTIWQTIPVLEQQQKRFHQADQRWSTSLEAFMRQKEERTTASPQPSHNPDDRRNRKTMLERVRSFWVKGLLEQSLHGAAFIALDLHEQPNLVMNPWRLILQEMNQNARILPSGTSITQVYDEAGDGLLILGEPGSGKTTLLLQLARDLLDRASLDETHPMPVVFNLSTWAVKRQPLTEWLVEELNTKYQVPQKLSESWVDTGQVLPLLDGLDEVARRYRAVCIDTINAYRQKQGLVPLVVCSRTTEYLMQATKVLVPRAVTIQSLTALQINDYLKSAAGQLEALQVVLHNDPSFQELASTPLMLSILTLTYHGKLVEDIPNRGSVEAQTHQIFEAYVQRMFQRRSVETHYTLGQTKYWLTWLAQQMVQHSQTDFYIERLQVSWLPKGRQSHLYASVAVGLIFLLIDTCSFGIVYGSFLDGLLIGLFSGVIYILLNGILFGWLVEREMKSKGGPRWATLFTQLLGNRGCYGLLSGLLLGIFVGFLKGPNAGSISGLIGVLYFVLLGKLDKKIQPAETIAWSWESVRRDGMKFLIGGLCTGFLYGCITAFPGLFNLSIFLPSLIFGLAVGFVIGLVITLIRGFSGSMLDTEKIIKPNQGIWNSFRNSARLALFSGIAFGVVFYIFFSLIIYQVVKVGYVAYFPPNSGLIYGTSDGLVVASLIWLINGGLACIQHLMLRVLLWQTRCTPWNYPRFLDYASERIILRKIGGGYVFVHRLLLEYFANLDMKGGSDGSSPTPNFK